MKLSFLLNNYNNHQYILGNIFSNAFFDNDRIFFISVSKIQHTNKNFKINDGYIKYKNHLIKKGYDAKILSEINSIKFPNNCFGVIIEFENDLKINQKELICEIYKKYISEDKKEFIRGIFDASSSIDSTTGFITRDLKKEMGENFVYYLAEILSLFFKYKSLNLNPRFQQPSFISKSKNTQFRLKFVDFFTLIGTERQVTINIVNGTFHKFKKMDKINWKCKNDIWYIDMSHLMEFSKEISNENHNKKLINVLNDFRAHKDYKNGIIDRDFITHRLSEASYNDNNKKPRRKKIKIEIKEKLLKNADYCDFITGEKFFKKDSNFDFSQKNSIVDFHHIIPYAKRNILLKEGIEKEKLINFINDENNLIPLDPLTHARIHRSTFIEKKIILEKLYRRIEKFLIHSKILLSFNLFCKLYY